MVSGDQDETCWDTPLTPEPADGILGKLAEGGSKDRNSYQRQLSQIFIYDAWLREEGKISHCPFLYKFVLAGKNIGYPSFPGTAVAFLLAFCVLRTWLGNHQVGGPQNMAGELYGCTPFAARYGWTECRLHSICG